MFRGIGQWLNNVSLGKFVLGIVLFHLLFFQLPLLRFVWTVVDSDPLHRVLQLLSLQGLQLLMLVAFLLFVSIFSLPVLRVVSIVIFLANGLALYFMDTYRIEFSRSMIGNILNTDTREVSELLSLSILVYILPLGLLPAWVILRVRFKPQRWLWRLPMFALSVLLLLGWSYIHAASWPWYDKHLSRMSGLVLPWSYLLNTPRYFQKVALRNREQLLLPDAHFLELAPARKQIVVLVIGEAARAENFSHYTYHKETNPFTSKRDDLYVFPAGESCATNTIASVACIVTHQGRDADAYTTDEPIQSYLTRHGVETIFLRNNSGMPPIKVKQFIHGAERAATCTGDNCPKAGFDEVLNWNIGAMLDGLSADRVFVTLHQNGSHGPSYFLKYPEEFAYFSPVCATVEVAKCDTQSLYNAYDNSIRYTDWLLADLIEQLDAIEDADIAMIYVSDHGQSLGENGLYLHGIPLAFAPEQQRKIPFIVWMNANFRDRMGINPEAFIPQITYPHDFPFHSIMGALGMRSEIYRPQFDIFHPARP